MEVLKERKRIREEVIKKAKEWARSLNFKATVILIGSYARGDFNLWSDVDIVIVSNDLKGSPLERLKEIEYPPGFEVIPLTTDELQILLRKNNPIALDIKHYGIILRDDLGLSKVIKKPE